MTAALTLQRFLRTHRSRVVRPTPELWRRVRRMARGDPDPALVDELLHAPGWADLDTSQLPEGVPLPLLVRQLGPVDRVTAACGCALVAAGMLEGAVPARPELLNAVMTGIAAWDNEECSSS